MSKNSHMHERWSEVLKHLMSHSPTAQALAKTGQEERLLTPLKLRLEHMLATLSERDLEQQALLEAAEKLIGQDALVQALRGDQTAHYNVVEQLIHGYISVRPWGELSERELATLWCGWSQTLSEAGGLEEADLWVKVPSVKLTQWQDLGVESQLTEALDTLRSDDDEIRRVGVRFRGVGKSAQIAFARRWLISRGEQASFFSLHQRAPLEKVLLIDDLNLSGRGGRWVVGEWLATYHEKSTLIIWSEHSHKNGFISMLIETLDHSFDVDLDERWHKIDHPQVNGRLDLPTWLTQPDPNLDMVDHLRCLSAVQDPIPTRFSDSISDLDAFAALLGPVAPIRVLCKATHSGEDVIEELLKGSGWIEVGECPKGSGLFAPTSLLFWRESLIEGGRRAHQCAHVLIEAVESTYLPQERGFLINALQRLSRLRGREGYQGQVEGKTSLQRASIALQTIKSSLTHTQPNPLCLSTLCGLGFDWGIRGPKEGLWADTLHALQVGAAAAERLRDPQMAGRLLHLLGKIALEDGRSSMSKAALEGALKLLYATRLAEEATNAARLMAEVELLEGDLDCAHLKLKEAEHIAQALSMPREAWHARFRAGQLHASAGDHEKALEVWSTLTQGEAKPEYPLLGESALGTLFLEMAASQLSLDRTSEARFTLQCIDDSHLMRRVLWSICDALALGDDPSSVLSEALVSSQRSRSIGFWLALQDWRAMIVLSGHFDDEESEVLSIKETRLGLELCVKVIVGARDRLGLMKLYLRLTALYQHLDEKEASIAALAMADAWAQSINQEAKPSSESQWMALKTSTSDELIKSTRAQANEEVERLLKHWTQTPMSHEAESTQ